MGGESARGVMSICHKEFIFQETRFSVYGPPPNGEALNRVTVLNKLKMGGRTLNTLKHRKSRKNITFPTNFLCA